MSQQDFAKPSTTRKAAPKKAAGKGRSPSKKAPPKAPPPAPSKGRGKLIVLLVLLLGGFAYTLYLLQSVPPAPVLPVTQEQAPQKKAAEKTSKPAEPEQTQRFKFYDLLPQSEIEAPEVDAYQFKERDAETVYNYVIQTGSFRSLADAERQKAMIAFQGLKADIKTVQNAQGTTWHRVSTGPFTSRSDMNNALDKLVAINIEPLVKKIKP